MTDAKNINSPSPSSADIGEALRLCEHAVVEGVRDLGLSSVAKRFEREFAKLREAITSDPAQRPPHRVDDHMTRARRLVENHIEAFGMVPHPDLIKDAIADMSQQSFDLGFQAAGGSVSLSSTTCGGGK